MNDRPCLTDNSICTTTTAEHAGALVVGVSGELDMATAARARAAVSDAICRRGCRQLVLDMTGVEFLGSHGLQVLADTAAVTTQGGHGLLRVAVGRRKRVLRPIQLAGLDAVLALDENVEDAIARFRGCVYETMPDQIRTESVVGAVQPAAARSAARVSMVTRQFEAHVAHVRDSVALDGDGADLRPNPAGAGEQGAAAPNCRGRRGCPDATR